jgi:hypothetical protein
MVRIRSEHAIGFLKGRFHSLKSLRVNINDARSHKFATYWVAACIGLHSFAMQCEEEENTDEEEEPRWRGNFIDEGLSSSDEDSEGGGARQPAQLISSRRLRAARKHREKLKRRLFRAKGRN